MICSCNPSKKLDKLNKKHPELLANFCRDTFPCVTTKIDTLIKYDTNYTSIKFKDWDSIPTDTIWLTHSRTQLIDKPVYIATRSEIKTIIKTIKDSASIRSCELELISCNNKCNDLLQQNNKLKNKVSAKNRWIMLLIIALLLSIMCNIIQLKK